MPTTFHRLHTDRTRTDAALDGVYAGPQPSACWLIGGGPSLSDLPCSAIAASPTPKMSINLAGTRLLRPNLWTSYDPSARFHRSIYLDPGVTKFVHRRRAMDLVPETTFKVCECPNTFFFDRDGDRGFADFLAPTSRGIVDWADSMLQALDILYRLGFRIVYLAGCEMRVQPSPEQIARAADKGVDYDPRQPLAQFLADCQRAQLSDEQLDQLPPGRHYHFNEHKPIRAAANTDRHYFRIAQYLRLSRRSLAAAGMQLISVTPGSRLNDYFPYHPVRQVLRRILRDVGNPRSEPVEGLYQNDQRRTNPDWAPMRDYRPHNWPPDRPQPPTDGNNTRNPNGDLNLLIEAEGYQQLQLPPRTPHQQN